MHPDWKGNVAFGNDIALIRLTDASKKQPLDVLENDEKVFSDGQLLMALGYGVQEDRCNPAVLQQAADLKFLGNEKCNELWDGIIQDSMICSYGHQDICDGKRIKNTANSYSGPLGWQFHKTQ